MNIGELDKLYHMLRQFDYDHISTINAGSAINTVLNEINRVIEIQLKNRR